VLSVLFSNGRVGTYHPDAAFHALWARAAQFGSIATLKRVPRQLDGQPCLDQLGEVIHHCGDQPGLAA